jgi:hypothetical protein
MSAGHLVRNQFYSTSCTRLLINYSVKLYFFGLGGGHPMMFLMASAGGLVLTETFNIAQTWYLGYWASQYDDDPPSEVSVS